MADLRQDSDWSHLIQHNLRGGSSIVRPPRWRSPVKQWRRQLLCHKHTGHCWHVESNVDRWCCECSAATDGTPRNDCRWCGTHTELEDVR